MRKITTLSIMFLLVMFSISAYAQEKDKKDNKVRIKLMKKNEKGDLIKVDTSFIVEKGQNKQKIINKIMKENGFKSESSSKMLINLNLVAKC